MNEERNQNTNPESQPSQYVTRLQTIERQIGENVLAALDADASVAVLTTVVSGMRADRVVSVPLTGEQVQDISAILAQARTEIDPDVTEDDDDLIGFHVVLKNDDAKNE